MTGSVHIFLILVFLMDTCNIKTRAGGPINIAAGKTAYQITTEIYGDYSYAAAKAVDGNTISNLEGECGLLHFVISHTKED